MAEKTSDAGSATSAAVTVDKAGWFLAVSAQFLEFVGRPVEGLVGLNLTDLVHPLDAGPVRQMLAAAAGAGTGVFEVRFFDANDLWRRVRLSVATVSNERITLHLVAIVESAPSRGVDASPESLQEPTGAASPSPAESVATGAGVARPARPEEVDDDFPYDDSPEHLAYVAALPGADIGERRVAIRNRAGSAATPMLEIDRDGRTVFVSGAWTMLSTEGASGADVFEELIERSGRADAILQAIDDAFTNARSSRHELRISERPPRWIQVFAIPSPHRSGVIHALVSVVAESELTDLADLPAPAPGGTDGSPIALAAFLKDKASKDKAPPEPVETAATHGGGESDKVASHTDAPAGNEFVVSAEPTHELAPEAVVVHTSGQARPAHHAVGDAMAPTDEALPSVAPGMSLSGSLRAWGGSLATAARRDPAVELLDPAGTHARALAIAAAVATYLAMQALYLGPVYGWPSPIGRVLDSQRCLVQPLCDNDVLRFNHLGVLALIAAVALFTVLLTHVGPRHLVRSRPAAPSELAATSWRLDPSGPGIFAWLAVLAIVIVTAQTVFTNGVSTTAWLAATLFGALAAWRSDRDARVPLGATMAALAIALACLLTTLGVGGTWLGEHRITSLVVVGVGVAFFVFALRLQRDSDSSFDPIDFSLMLGLALLALVLGLLRHHTWRYAYIGDEWSFFEGAMDGLHSKAGLDTFDIGGPNDHFTGLTFELQAAVMRLGGADVWGWRLSSLMPMVLSVPAMYAFTRWLAGRTAAIAAAIALAAGHMLLSFSMVGYPNTQSLVAVSASFAALAWAHQRPSALRFFMLGSAVGSTFLVYATARLALLPIAVLFLLLFRDTARSMLRRLGWALLGLLAMAAPTLFSWQSWDALFRATPVQAEEQVLGAGGVGRQAFENTFAGWLSFIGSDRNTHFIVGPHLDVISAVLFIVGLGFVVARCRADKALLGFLVGGIGLWTAIDATQRYAPISNTRSFMIPLVYCVFVGIGVSAVLPLIHARVPSKLPRWATNLVALAGFGLVLVLVNQWHISGYANERQQLTEQALLVQQFARTESGDGQGMRVHVGWPEEDNERLNVVLRAHDIAAERIVIVPGTGTLNTPQLCATAEPTMLVVHRDHPMAEAWTTTLAACWQTIVVTVSDPAGALKLLRVTNPAGIAEFDKPASQRFSRDAETDDFSLADTIDIATDGAEVGFALVRGDDGGGTIHRLDGGGSFDLVQNQPIDFDITSDGLFVVAANGGDDRLVWYDGKGNVVRRYPGQDDFPTIGGLAVDGDRLWISDTAGSRVIALDAEFEIDEIRSAQGALLEPASVTAGPDGAVWVYSAGSGEIVLVDASDQLTLRLSAQVVNAVDGPRLSSTRLGWLIRTIPERSVVELVNPLGEVADSRGGANRPRAAASRSGELVVADPRWNDVPVVAVDERWAPAERGAIDWGVRSISADALAVFDSPFIIDELREPGPIATELTPTEPVVIGDGQIWRSVGAVVLGELHAIAALGDGAYAADVNGRLIRFDNEGAAIAVVGLGGGGASFVSDLGVDSAGVTWVLDAGLGRLMRVGADGAVTDVEADRNVVSNARGLGVALDDTVWIASTAAAQLTRVDAQGATVETLALPDRQPSDVVQMADGTLWFVDAQDMELVHLTAAGDVLTVIELDAFSSIESPHLALQGLVLWVTEPEVSAVFVVDVTTDEPTGDRVELLRPDGTPVIKPIGIAAGPDGRLWIADSLGAAVIILTP